VLTAWHYPPMALHAVYPAARFIPGKVRAWVDYLLAALGSIEGIKVNKAPDKVPGA